MNGTTSVPMSVLRYVVDKVELIVPIWGVLLQCEFPEVLDSKCTQSGNIHSKTLDVHAVKQSALKLSFQSSQHKLDKNLTL